MNARRPSAVLFIACALACGQSQGVPGPAAAPALNSLTRAEQSAGWRLLFDGVSTSGWRNYMKPDLSEGWKAVDGALTRVGRSGDIVTSDKYRNFDLVLEWKIGPGGNSGILYRGIEGPAAIYYSAPEMQVLDDNVHPDGKSQLTSAGAAYGLYPAPRGAVKPVGEWNRARVLVNGNHARHWLNGVKMADYEFHSADWKAKVAASKFKQWPEYGQAPEGYIALQDHGDWVAFRNIKIRVLP